MTAAALLAAVVGGGLLGLRLAARSRRRYVRLMVEPYRGDRTLPEALLATMAAVHAVVAVQGPRRLLTGQPSLALETHLHLRADGAPLAWLAICVPRGLERQVQAALRASYPNCALRPVEVAVGRGAGIIRLHKRLPYREPVRRLSDIDPERPPVERLLRTMAAAGGPSVVQLALTPAPAVLGRAARPGGGDREGAAESTDFGERPRLPGPYFYADVRVIGRGRGELTAIAAELRAGSRVNRLVGRRLAPGRRWAFERRIARGEGNPIPSPVRQTYAAEEVAALWQLPSVGFAALPVRRRATPVAPAPAGILRAWGTAGLVADDHGPVTIHRELRRQNTAVVGTVEQGKTSYLVASIREDLRREDCAVIVLDPKGDAAEAALSAVGDGRVCTLLDLGRPTCGFNPLAVRAPVDAIADYVVAALRQLFAEGEVRGSSDRYLRNAVIGVLGYDRRGSLWDVARLLEVGPAGVAFRARVADRLTTMPEFAEVASFLSEELPGQLADARASTTAKLDAPANKLARVLNSSSVKRVLVNRSLSIDFDRLIERREVLIVRGALGELGPGNVSVLMQLLIGMLDAALARAQDRRGEAAATAVALKIDEAPLVINAAFAQTLALKRSAGLETVACWQTDAQWAPELRAQLDALFAHRVLFATASSEDARAAAGLLMAEFSDQLRSGDRAVASLAAPDVRLHLPRHTAIVSWSTPNGRERPFIGRTLPLVVDRQRISDLAERQWARGGREVDLRTPPPRLDHLPPADPDPTTRSLPIRTPVGPHAEADSSLVELGRTPNPAPVTAGPRRAGPIRPPERAERVSSVSGPVGARPTRERVSVSSAVESTGMPAEVSSVPRAVEPAAGPDELVASAAGPDAERAARAPGAAATGRPATATRRPPAHEPDGLAAAPAGYSELLDLDAATRVRWMPVAPAARRPTLDAGELELLAWIAGARCVLSSQAHRRMNPGRALTTTQRRLKRLADAGLVARFQLHGGDGGGVPFCCSVTDAALVLLGLGGRRAPELGDETLAALRADVHTVGWLMALEARAGGALVGVLGPGRARLVPRREGGCGPGGLELGSGLRGRDFLTGDPAAGRRRPVERFLPVTPAAVCELEVGDRSYGAATTDLLVFRDPAKPAETVALIERCDHLIAGWWRLVPRYARLGSPPTAVIVCRDGDRATELAAFADRILVACLARIGQPPEDWGYPGRRGVVFAAERDLHDGRFVAWRVPLLVPTLRSAERATCEPIVALPAVLPPPTLARWR
ncbi:MAG: hypothetical protein ACR2KV_15325 [Solirubrobacteraceae bacterium]